MDPTVVDEALTRQIATIMLTGASVTQCAKQLAISNAAVRRITETDKYKELVTVTAEDQLTPALAQAKSALSKMANKAVKVLERAMDRAIETGEGMREGLEASKVVLKSVGLSEDADSESDSTINIIMPSGVEKTVTYEIEKE